MSETKKLLRHLLQDHKGKHNKITQAKLAKKLEMNTSTLRSELSRLREERNIPIGNMRDGYFIIQDKEELQEYVAHINGEIESKRNTIEHTTEAFAEFEPDEIDVEPDSEVIEDSYECTKCGGSVPKSERRYPKQGDYEDQPVCKMCYGKLLMNRR